MKPITEILEKFLSELAQHGLGSAVTIRVPEPVFVRLASEIYAYRPYDRVATMMSNKLWLHTPAGTWSIEVRE